LLTQVLLALIHVVAEETFETVGLIAGTIFAVAAAALLEATNPAVTRDGITKGLGRLTTSLGASLTGDTVQDLGLGGTTLRRNALVRPAFTHTPLARHVIAGVGLTDLVSATVGALQTILILLTQARIDTCPVAAAARITIGIGRTGIERLTGVVLPADVSRDAVVGDRTERPVGTLTVVLVTDAEIATDAIAGILLSAASQPDGAEEESDT
jgi:hypothetical protein